MRSIRALITGIIGIIISVWGLIASGNLGFLIFLLAGIYLVAYSIFKNMNNKINTHIIDEKTHKVHADKTTANKNDVPKSSDAVISVSENKEPDYSVLKPQVGFDHDPPNKELTDDKQVGARDIEQEKQVETTTTNVDVPSKRMTSRFTVAQDYLVKHSSSPSQYWYSYSDPTLVFEDYRKVIDKALAMGLRIEHLETQESYDFGEYAYPDKYKPNQIKNFFDCQYGLQTAWVEFKYNDRRFNTRMLFVGEPSFSVFTDSSDESGRIAYELIQSLK